MKVDSTLCEYNIIGLACEDFHTNAHWTHYEVWWTQLCPEIAGSGASFRGHLQILRAVDLLVRVSMPALQKAHSSILPPQPFVAYTVPHFYVYIILHIPLPLSGVHFSPSQPVKLLFIL